MRNKLNININITRNNTSKVFASAIRQTLHSLIPETSMRSMSIRLTGSSLLEELHRLGTFLVNPTTATRTVTTVTTVGWIQLLYRTLL